MNRQYRSLLWGVFFCVLFLLSLHYWNWAGPGSMGWLNLPNWVYYFIFLQLLFFAGFWVFSSQYWQNNDS